MKPESTRRDMLSHSIAAAGAAALLGPTAPAPAAAVDKRPPDEPFGYCFNTSTIRGQKLPLVAEIEIASRAGFHGIEPWVGEIDQYMQSGGSCKDLHKRIVDAGLTVENVIGFAEWIVDDDARRAKGLEEARRIMDLTLEIGGGRLAAPPAGVSDADRLDLAKITERYHALLLLGDHHGVVPQLELWGFARVLSKLSEVTYVAVETGHPQACILADCYHIYKGGSDFVSLRLIDGAAMHVFHINDYPAHPDRKDITDAYRVYPGDGIAPLGPMFRHLRDNDFRGMLSLELFNRDYWKQDPLLVARTGLEKTRAAVQTALR